MLSRLARLGLFLVTAASFLIFFNWQYIGLMMLTLFVHELGHAMALNLYGLRSKIFFLPLMGAVTVARTENSETDGTDEAKGVVLPSARAEANVILAGPVVGLLFSLLAAVIYQITGWVPAAMTALLAVVHLFNLLPFAPLDGGRMLNALIFGRNRLAGFAFNGLVIAGLVALWYIGDIKWIAIAVASPLILLSSWSSSSREYAKLRLRYLVWGLVEYLLTFIIGTGGWLLFAFYNMDALQSVPSILRY